MTSNLNQYNPDVVSPPGATLQDILEERGMSQAVLASHMGRPRKTINEIIKAKTELTSETALQLERVLNVPAAFWTRREADYREHLARKKDSEQLSKQTKWLGTVHAGQMVKAGWIPAGVSKTERLTAVLTFFNVASPERLKDLEVIGGAAFRRSRKFKSDKYALAAWLKRGEFLAGKTMVAPYSPQRFEFAMTEARRLCARGAASELVGLCAQAGVVLLVVPEIDGARVSGAARWIGGRPVIQMSLRYKKDDRFWFTFFHEAGHILLHNKNDAFVDEDDGHSDVREAEADRFAADTLIPPAAFAGFLSTTPHFSAEAVETFAKRVGIAPGVVVGRLQHEKKVRYSQLNEQKRPMELEYSKEP